MNMHEMGVFDKWFEGIGYHNSVFYWVGKTRAGPYIKNVFYV